MLHMVGQRRQPAIEALRIEPPRSDLPVSLAGVTGRRHSIGCSESPD